MSKTTRIDTDSFFPEFRRDEEIDEAVAEEAPEQEEAPKNDPLVLKTMARLAELLGDETRLLREGNYEAFSELQREKGELIRQVERLEHSRHAMAEVEGMDQETLMLRLEDFNATVEKNMRSIGAVKDAITHVRTAAIRKLEDERGDGVYAKDGEKRSLHHLSFNDNKVKL
ncbi:hypothetical protein [Parvularcula lutaonensis]|uniref:Flagellar biosynthesis protein FlgN n=1 Tax=Parvularcula lutaonensis TaxID=491923 RepID=A0ABV7MD87_9PROT|nr:hypothetical protein [Parvularcula lutaonensis]GGY50768.1 hypothetical protein GCM10007148_19470 [Parvularcula lutaonensis]